MKTEMVTWLAVHGNLCLALRHPGNTSNSRQRVVDFTLGLGKFLVDSGAITQEELDRAQKVEAEEGSPEFRSL